MSTPRGIQISDQEWNKDNWSLCAHIDTVSDQFLLCSSFTRSDTTLNRKEATRLRDALNQFLGKDES